MIKRFENKLMMLKAVLSLLKQNSEKLSVVPALAALISKLESLVAGIKSLRQITESDTTGITAAKQEQQEMLIDKAYELSSVLYAMAAEKEDKVLQGKVDFTESDLQNARGNDLVATCSTIANLVSENLEGLSAYGIEEADLSELESLNTDFSENLPSHRVSVAERKAANEKLKEVFKQAGTLLEDQIDRLMVRMRSRDADLYVAYENARSIVNYGIRHEKGEEGEATTEEQP